MLLKTAAVALAIGAFYLKGIYWGKESLLMEERHERSVNAVARHFVMGILIGTAIVLLGFLLI